MVRVRIAWVRTMLGLFAVLIGCGDEAPSRSQDDAPTSAGTSAIASREDPRPTIILAVLDTTRADAISAYGEVVGTTPRVDAIASRGTRFDRAFAPSPWTVSSHASLFSGLRVDQHGVGLDGVYRVDDGISTLAEELGDAGYVTAGFAENALVSREFGFDQGFAHYEVTDMADVVQAEQAGDPSMQFFDLASRVRRWARTRDRSKPAFVFVNIMDAHDPYSVRETNPWAPADARRSELEAVVRRHAIPSALCRRAPSSSDAKLLRGLYLGDVAAADRKLGDVLDALQKGFGDEPTITIVTADHGEHLGEHRLWGHRFSVRTPALRIPLVVAGAPDLSPGVSAAPVDFSRLHASIRCWGLAEDCDRSLAEEEGDAPIYSVWSDRSATIPPPVLAQLGLPESTEAPDRSREGCTPDDPVFGALVSLIRYPVKVNWAGEEILSVHDLSWDLAERSDQPARMNAAAAAAVAELTTFVETRVQNRAAVEATELSEEAQRALRALGYAE